MPSYNMRDHLVKWRICYLESSIKRYFNSSHTVFLMKLGNLDKIGMITIHAAIRTIFNWYLTQFYVRYSCFLEFYAFPSQDTEFVVGLLPFFPLWLCYDFLEELLITLNAIFFILKDFRVISWWWTPGSMNETFG